MFFNTQKKLSEEQLFTGCVKGDRKVCGTLYREWAPYMKAVCKRYVANSEIAEDIMHEAFIKVYEGVGKIQWKGDGTFKAWVVRVMINACIDYIKSENNRNQHRIEDIFDIAETDDDIEEDISLLGIVKQKGITRDDLMEILETLPESTRLVFNLYAIEQLKHKEIAELLGIAEEASRTRLKRARLQLKEKLAIKCNYRHKI